MPIFQTGGYQVRSSAVNKIKQAIKEFVEYVRVNESGTKMYLAWQEKADPSRFLHLFIFEDEVAQKRHGESEAVKRFEEAYSPELAGGDVVFTDYKMVAGKREGPAESSDGDAGAMLKNFYDAVKQRDLAKARKYLADDLRFVGLFETYPNAEAYLKALTGLLGVTTRLDVKRIIAQGNDAAVFFELETKPPVEATTLVAERHEIKNGKIVFVESAFDGRPFEKMFVHGKSA